MNARQQPQEQDIMNMKLRLAFFGAAIAILSPMSKAQTGLTPAPGHWPQWRGPNRDNVSTETGLLKQWPDEGPPLLWKRMGLGNGVMSLAVAGGRIYLLAYGKDHEYAISLDGEGKIVWRSEIGRADPPVGAGRGGRRSRFRRDRPVGVPSIMRRGFQGSEYQEEINRKMK